ncbi:Uncharacterised protein [Mycobacteroides abscessus subsp. abscessus]|nr:Uncharacterised protein [Mycobacteroides abscessus subsp. abscessus]
MRLTNLLWMKATLIFLKTLQMHLLMLRHQTQKLLLLKRNKC